MYTIFLQTRSHYVAIEDTLIILLYASMYYFYVIQLQMNALLTFRCVYHLFKLYLEYISMLMK